MNQKLNLPKLFLICALLVVAKLIIQAAPILLIPMLVALFYWLRRGYARSQDDDPADWWKHRRDE